MFLLLTRDEHVVFVFSFFFGAIAERRHTIAVLLVRKPFAFVSKNSRNDLLATISRSIANNASISLQTVAPFRNSISTPFIILPLAHIIFCYTAIQLLVFDDKTRI